MSLQTVAEWWLRGDAPVSIDVGVARARICLACPMNKPPDNEYGQYGDFLSRLFAWRIRSGFTLDGLPESERLGECSACGCYLRVKVWAPDRVILSEEPKAYHSLCWINSVVDNSK